jgi:hypothetical protein
MKTKYNSIEASMNVSCGVNKTIEIPESATVAQLKEFDNTISNIVFNPMELVSDAFERIFNEPFDDGTEDESPKAEGEQEVEPV